MRADEELALAESNFIRVHPALAAIFIAFYHQLCPDTTSAMRLIDKNLVDMRDETLLPKAASDAQRAKADDDFFIDCTQGTVDAQSG